MNKKDDVSAVNGPPQTLATPLPRMWIQNRGAGYMTSRMAAVRFENGALKIYYAQHEQNGRQMDGVPRVSLPSVAAPELPVNVRRGVVEIDIWEDEQVHSVKLWLSNGRMIQNDPLVERIKERVEIDYADEARRHRLIYFQRFRRTEEGLLEAYGESFSDQPQCCGGGGGGCAPSCDVP